MVTDGTQVKILAWYDNEWGYANRLVELARMVADRGVKVNSGPGGAQCPRRVDLRRRVPAAERCGGMSGRPAQLRPGDGAYWADTLTDGATRTLVLFYFDQLGYTPCRSPRCSSSTRSPASSRISSAAGWPRASD